MLRQIIPLAFLAICLAGFSAPSALAQDDPVRVFISVDMEGIGGIGTAAMTSSSGKDYAKGRQFMTGEVNAVVAAVFEHGPAEVLVNDSHGDMQNLLHEQLDPRVTYIQGNIKPLGMMQGLDASFDAAVFIGYHARAGTEGGFLAHTGSGAVKGVWIDGTELGEGGMNALLAASHRVPVIVASGDLTFTEQFAGLVAGVRTVATKQAVGARVAMLKHPQVVQEELRAATLAALADLGAARTVAVPQRPVVRIRFATTTRPDVVLAIPGMRRIDGYTVEFEADSMDAAYRMIRLLYKYVSW